MADENELVAILEAVLLAASKPLTLEQLGGLFADGERPAKPALRSALDQLDQQLLGRGIELKRVASGFRLQVRAQYSGYIARMHEEKAPRYSRALLETLVLIAYRQPITRGEIEAVRGVAVSSQIIRTLLEREWVSRVGHREVPGRPGLYGTTRQFLDYFNLEHLDQLPPLAQLQDLALPEDEADEPSGLDSIGSVMEQNSEAAEAPAEQFFAELDQLENQLPNNFESLLKGHFSTEEEDASAIAKTECTEPAISTPTKRDLLLDGE